jgi:hypothetical protein
VLSDVSYDATLDPFNGVVRFDNLSRSDIFEAILRKTDLEDDSLEHQDSLLVNVVCLWVFNGREVNVLDDLVDHEAHLHILELVTVIHAHGHASRLAHGEQHCDQEEAEYEDLNDQPLHRLPTERSELLSTTLNSKLLFVITDDVWVQHRVYGLSPDDCYT